MGRRRAPSLESLSSLITDVHDAGVDGAGWPTALKHLGGLFDAPRATIWMQDTAGTYRAIHTLVPDDRITRDYTEHYGRRDLLRPAIMNAPAGTVLTNEMVVPRSEFVRTEFYADFAAPHGLIDSIQARIFDAANSSYSGYVGISSSLKSGTFEHEHVRLLALLLPHLSRAMQMQLRLARLGVEHDCALEVLDRLRHGVLVLDAQARVLHANSAAETILRKRDGLGVEPVSRQLRASAPGQTNALRRLVAQAATGHHGAIVSDRDRDHGVLRLERAAEAPLLLCVVPLRAEAAWNVSRQPAVLLLLSVPENKASLPLLASLRALYGLTPAEAAVAGRIGQAEAVEAAAAAMGITPATLRWHLQRVFEKTGTARQAELVRLVERLDFVGFHPGSRPRLA